MDREQTHDAGVEANAEVRGSGDTCLGCRSLSSIPYSTTSYWEFGSSLGASTAREPTAHSNGVWMERQMTDRNMEIGTQPRVLCVGSLPGTRSIVDELEDLPISHGSSTPRAIDETTANTSSTRSRSSPPNSGDGAPSGEELLEVTHATAIEDVPDRLADHRWTAVLALAPEEKAHPRELLETRRVPDSSLPVLVVTDEPAIGNVTLEYDRTHWIWLPNDWTALMSILENRLAEVCRVQRREQHLSEAIASIDRELELLHHAEELAKTGGWAVDLDTRTVQWTDGVYAIHELPSTYEPTLEDAITFYHPADRRQLREAFELCAKTGESYELELRLLTANDQQRWVVTTGELVSGDGEADLVCGAIRDITEYKHRTAELETYTTRLEQFASRFSHEFRNSMSVLSNRIELARATGEDKHFDNLERAMNRMDRLVDDVVTIATEDDIELTYEPIELSAIATACWDVLRTPNMTLTVETDRCILADEDRLRQLLANLFRNAIEHTEPGTTVTVGHLEDGFYVADDGRGIPLADRDLVFDVGTTDIDHGAGLGLPVVATIAAAHDWELALTDGPNGGARFEFRNVETI